MKNLLAKELHSLYRHCDPAYSSMDMFGKGYIEPETFINTIACNRIISNFNIKSEKYKINIENIKEFTNISNLF